jgi:Plasma-membrane choline transporter
MHALLQVASQAVAAMPSLLFVPLLPFILEVGLIVYWVAVSAVLYSAGTPTPHWREPSAPATAPLGLRQLLPVGGSANASTATPLTPQPRPDTSNMTQQV